MIDVLKEEKEIVSILYPKVKTTELSGIIKSDAILIRNVYSESIAEEFTHRMKNIIEKLNKKKSSV